MDYKPFENRAEHEMVNKVCADLIRIERLVTDIREEMDIYLQDRMSTLRKEDE